MLRSRRGAGDVRLPLGAQADTAAVTEAAWKEFHVRLRAFVSRRIADRADAEDIVQDVFMEMHRSLPSLRTRDRLGPWLHRTARNAVIDHYRRPRRRREVLAGGAGDLDGPAPAADARKAEAVAARCLAPLIQRLPAAHRRALEMVELRGLTQKAAAEREGVTVSGMKARVQRGRRQLKGALLQCCEIALDGRRSVMGCRRREPGAGACGCGAD
jgi:RNA polymerase sigma-70 factor (ECF subfamily)